MWENNNVAGERNRRRRDCDFVFECLLDLLEDALGEDNNNHCKNRCNRNENVAGERNRRERECEDVFECLEELLEGEQEDNNNHCRRHCNKRY